MKVMTAVFFGVTLYFALILIHEEWEERAMMRITGPPPAVDLNNPWILVALVVAVWALLVALERYATRRATSSVAKR